LPVQSVTLSASGTSEVVSAAVAVVLDCHRLAGTIADQLGNVREVVDRLAVDLSQQVADLQAGRLGRAVGEKPPTTGRIS
jgi:hypothetical protein